MGKTSNKTVNVKADFRQFLADNAGLMALTAFFIGAMPVYAKRADRYLMLAMAALMVFMLSILVIRYIMLVSVRWMLEDETLCRIRGVFSKQTDYIELYRITDDQESRSFFQWLLGIKTVTVYSTDKSDSVSDILGVPADMDLIGMLREKVEDCKRERNIYEIANR